MRQFTWHVFSVTGSVESYLLYKDLVRYSDENFEGEDDQTGPPEEQTVHQD